MPAHKDVDGTHPTNQGHLAFGSGTEYVPATPAAVMLLLERSPHWPLRGRRVAVIGRSIVVGAPVALLVMAARRDRHDASQQNRAICSRTSGRRRS